MKRALLLLLIATTAHAQGSGSQGSATGSAAGSGTGAGPTILNLPLDVDAPEASAAASPTNIKLGSRFTLFVTVTFAPGVTVNLQEPIELSRAFEVKRKASIDRTAPDGRRTREYQLEVYAWELGEMRVPPVTVTFTSAGKIGQVQTNAVPVRVIGVLGDTDDPKLMRDSATPVRLKSRDWFWAYIGGAVGGVLVGSVALWWFRRKRRRRVVRLVAGATTSVPRRVDMTSQRALERLLAIEKSGVLDSEDTRKTGYLEMIEVIRDYLGSRFRVRTADLTTWELMRALHKTAAPDEQHLVGSWLDRCDLVRYGGYQATRLDAGDVLADARALVIATTQVLAPEAGTKEAA